MKLFPGKNHHLHVFAAGINFDIFDVKNQSKSTEKNENCSYYGFIYEGSLFIEGMEENKGISYHLVKGMYFSLSGAWQFSENSKYLFIAAQKKDSSEQFPFAQNHVGGPIESTGRLRYIDGCSDSLLIYPSKQGQPCLNFLHFPKNTHQSFHTHPTFRAGVVYEGSGVCYLENDQKIELKAGDVFYLPSDLRHCFKSNENNLNVIAFHPDTDWGPTDEKHPMINKTILVR